MKSMRPLLGLITAILGAFAPGWAGEPVPPIITNLVSTQRSGTFFVDIAYDLVDPDSPSVYVIIEASSDKGTNYAVPIKSLSGDVGPVAPGTGKKIVWNAWIDWAGNYTTNAKVRLIADDTASAIPEPPITPPSANLIFIPSGSFRMGGSMNVWLTRSFWMDKYEVTRAAYGQVMGTSPGAGPNQPVSVTWPEASAYCQALTTREQGAGRIRTDQAYRLPTEAEWEYACRAGTTTTYSFGEDPSVTRLRYYAWYSDNSPGGACQDVGGKAPNRWGLYDMMGNQFEWCSDWFGIYPGGNVVDPQGAATGTQRVARGGNYASNASWCPSAVRFSMLPSNPSGFRVVLYPAN
jgi:formylglycine-generating enzyme required for sulfatase activity